MGKKIAYIRLEKYPTYAYSEIASACPVQIVCKMFSLFIVLLHALVLPSLNKSTKWDLKFKMTFHDFELDKWDKLVSNLRDERALLTIRNLLEDSKSCLHL